jgi:C4-dicarboxylate-specific signal transduction histidine kinase
VFLTTGSQELRNVRLFGFPDNANSTVMRYVLALAFVLFALALTLLLQHFEQDRPTLFLFFAAIVAAAWFGGAGPGCFAVAASIPAGLYFYSAALHTFSITVDNVVLFVFFGSCAIAGGFLSSRQREAEESLQRTHHQLEIKAGELQHTNTALMSEIAERRRAEFALRDAQAELARVARLTTMGELAASIAHEINQPLAAVVTNAGTCLRWLDCGRVDLDEARAAAQRIIRDGNRASEVIGRIRAMVREALPERAPLDINDVIRVSLALLDGELKKQRIKLRLGLAPDVGPIRGDRILLQQVLLNLILNAIEAMSLVDDRHRELFLQSGRRSDGAIFVSVQDTGPGFLAGTLDKIFDAFVTTKPNGMGLGLSICRSIVEAHGGVLSASPARPRGAVFEVTLTETGD